MSSALLLYRLSCILYKVVLTFESVGETLKFNHSNESYWAVLFSGTVYHVDKVVLTFESVVIQKKDTRMYFPVVLFIMPNKI